jgi:acetate---CoA ligase (ADP-forming)
VRKQALVYVYQTLYIDRYITTRSGWEPDLTGEAVHRGITALLQPRSVAVLGASARRKASGNAVMANLRRHGYTHDLHVVHPTASVVDGFPTVPSVADLPRGLDLALVSLPAAAVSDALARLEAISCRAALVPTAGLDAMQARDLAEFAARSQIAVHGPNCMGVLNLTDDIPLWFYDGILTDEPPGNVALITQSGSASFLARAGEGTRFSKIISTGNEAGLTTADYLLWLAEDEATAAVGVVIESIRDVAAFGRSVRALREAAKPLIALKAGRTAAGSRASIAHTGALIGRDDGYAAFFRRLDVPLVTDYDEMAVALGCLAVPGLPRAAGTRIAVVTDSGGEAALAADLAERQHVQLGTFSPRTLHALAEVLPGAAPLNPLDAGASPGAGDDAYLRSYEIVAADPGVDAVMVIVEGHHTINRAEMAYEGEICTAIRQAGDSDHGKPIVAVSSSSISTSSALRQQLGPKVPLLRGISNGLAALRALAGNQRPVRLEVDRPADLPEGTELSRLHSAVAAVRGPLPARLAHDLLTAYRIPIALSVIASNVEDAQRWAASRYPVVVKVSSPDIAHRSEIGGVRTGVSGPAELADAIDTMRGRVGEARPGARIEGFEIQEQIAGPVEALLGFAADPVFGALVTVGSGGSLVELLADTTTGLAPLAAEEAEEVISETRLGAILAGYRNLVPVTDIRPLADALHRLSWLAEDFAGVLAEGDLNPLFVDLGTGRIRVADVLLVARPEPSAIEPAFSIGTLASAATVR